MSRTKGYFTLPGEAGYEKLTLRLAEKWGADVIRDSDGTQLSEDILQADYEIYSTVCVIRDHNAWAKEHPDRLQQTFLITSPVTAEGSTLRIPLMKEFFSEQFRVNASPDAMRYWQVWDRTDNTLFPRRNWDYDGASESIVLSEATPFHAYTVTFFAWRIWEEISMYNHVTNSWTSEHLMPIDPVYEETRDFLRRWMREWCEQHPDTDVVRFTSLFYNFAWFWGADERCRNLYTDWGSYDFTASPAMLDAFEASFGYALTAEDFVNQGKLHVTHMPPTEQKKDWMDFINRFVLSFARELVDIVHEYGKKAYVFYDDTWIGLEPWGRRFSEVGFDGLIKCVFSAFEVHLCSGADVPVHELRFHPYLFPVGLGGAPTFMEGGHPTEDARDYWLHVRRGILRAPIQRIGLGGYLHLTEDFPDFQDYIEQIADEFRDIRSWHEQGKPLVKKPRVAVLHSWGRLRSWTLSGHFHETYMHDLIHVNEALAGLPLEVDFISFEDVKAGVLDAYDVVINAGRAGTAWSGGDAWKDPEVVSRLTRWVYEGGAFIGIREPSAVDGYNHYFRMADVLGVDEDTGARVCHGRWTFEVKPSDDILPAGFTIPAEGDVFLTDGKAEVLAAHDGRPDLTVHAFGRGCGIYMAGFTYSPVNARGLLNLILHAAGGDDGLYLTDNAWTECTCFPDAGKLVITNNSDQEQKTCVCTENGTVEAVVPAFALVTKNLTNG